MDERAVRFLPSNGQGHDSNGQVSTSTVVMITVDGSTVPVTSGLLV